MLLMLLLLLSLLLLLHYLEEEGIEQQRLAHLGGLGKLHGSLPMIQPAAAAAAAPTRWQGGRFGFLRKP